MDFIKFICSSMSAMQTDIRLLRRTNLYLAGALGCTVFFVVKQSKRIDRLAEKVKELETGKKE